MILYRRHLTDCKHAKKGRNFAGCSCPIWIDRKIDGKRTLHSLETGNWEKAERKKDAFESSGEDKSSKPLKDALEAWEGYLVAQKLKASTLRKYRRIQRRFLKHCEDSGYMLVGQIGVDVIDGYRATRYKLQASTSAKELDTLRTFFRFCNKRRWCSENPAKDVTAPKIPPNEVVPYTREEITAILAACDQIGQEPYERLRAKAVLLLMRHTGLRISDACMLRKDQLRDGCVVLFTKKTGGHILLPLPSDVQRALDRVPVPVGAERDTGYFFWAGRSEAQTLITDVSRALKRVFDKSRVKDAHSHRFRHTLATDILAKGGTIADVADVLGISEHIARRHYAKWSAERRDRVFRIMAQVQGTAENRAENDTRLIHELFARPN